MTGAMPFGNLLLLSMIVPASTLAALVGLPLSSVQAADAPPATPATSVAPPALPVELLRYASSVDGTATLHADLCLVPDGRPKPIVAVMHGFAGGRCDVTPDIRALAARGVVAVAPDMRGRYQSNGRFDSCGLDVHDIVDAIILVARKYPAEVDTGNINILGYSGGGANSFFAFVRFPDLFHVAAPFFGLTNFALWYTHNPKQLDMYVGGSPADKPLEYAARNAVVAAGNNRVTRLHVFYDEREIMCPPATQDVPFLDAYRAAGGQHATVHVSKAADPVRWKHGYRTNHPDLAKADDIILKEIFSPAPDLSLPPRGELVVPGYLVTRHFKVFVEDGKRGVVKIAYDLTGNKPEIRVLDNPANLKVTVSLDSPLAGLGRAK